MEPRRILVTGATGYIGGSVLSQLLKSNEKGISETSVSGLVRGDDKAKLLNSKGCEAVLFDDLDASDQLRDIANNYDVVVNCALGYHPGSAKALIEGLGDRKRRTGKDVHYVHTTGTSNLGDQPITGVYKEDRIFSDYDEDIYAYQKLRNEMESYPQRLTDLTVVETGLKHDVKTYLIMSPEIYGIGSGFFNTASIQEPLMIRQAIKSQEVEFIGDGLGEWGHVHIADLVELYEIIFAKLLAGEELPNGEKGFYFSENGRFIWKEVAQGIAEALYTAGAIKTREPKSLSLDEAAAKWTDGDRLLAELGLASNARTRSQRSRNLGWKPQRGDEVFKNHYKTEVEEFLKAKKA